jgi:hypothetical protein
MALQVSAFQLHSNGHGHGHGHNSPALSDCGTSAENRVWLAARKHAIAQILEIGIALHRQASVASDRRSGNLAALTNVGTLASAQHVITC